MSRHSDQKLVQAVKQASNQLLQDKLEVFTGIVVSTENAMSDGLIDVQQVDGKIVTELTNLLAGDPYWQNYNYNNVSAEDAEDINNGSAGPKIWLNVELQAMPGDYNFVIPVVGSYVKVGFSKYQNPFIIQCQDVYYTSNFQYKTNNGIITDSSGMTISASNSVFNLSGTTNTSICGDTSTTNYTTIFNTATQIGLNVTEGASQLMTDTFVINAKNGAVLQGDTKVKVANTSTDLLTIMQDILTALQDISAVTVPSGGGNIGTLAPDLLVRISNLTTNIPNLLE